MKYGIAAVVGIVTLAGVGAWFYTRNDDVSNDQPVEDVELVEETNI